MYFLTYWTERVDFDRLRAERMTRARSGMGEYAHDRPIGHEIGLW